MLVGVEVGDGELHELQYDIFYIFFALELILDIAPLLVFARPHEIKQFHVVV